MPVANHIVPMSPSMLPTPYHLPDPIEPTAPPVTSHPSTMRRRSAMIEGQRRSSSPTIVPVPQSSDHQTPTVPSTLASRATRRSSQRHSVSIEHRLFSAIPMSPLALSTHLTGESRSSPLNASFAGSNSLIGSHIGLENLDLNDRDSVALLLRQQQEILTLLKRQQPDLILMSTPSTSEQRTTEPDSQSPLSPTTWVADQKSPIPATARLVLHTPVEPSRPSTETERQDMTIAPPPAYPYT